MTRKLLGLALAVILLVPVVTLAAELTGREIVDKQKNLHEVKNDFELQKMILVDKKGKKEVREVRRYQKEVEDDVRRGLIVFLSPPNIRGTALLTWEHKDAEDDQWLYMPARGKMQRIAKGGKKNYFMGTDFAYEDLRSEDLDAHKYNRLKDEVYKDQDCYVVESLPATKDEKKSSGYSKRVMWIKKDNFVTVKMDFYGRRGKLLKTQISVSFVNVKGDVWRADKTLMNHHQKKHKTLVGTVKRDLDSVIPDQNLAERFILKGLHTK